MKRLFRLLFAVSLPLLPVAPACANDTPLAPLEDGGVACREMADNCALPAERLGEPYQTCFETGSQGVPNACLQSYYDCVPKCRAALADLGAAGEGGAGAAGKAGSAGGG